MVKKYIESHWLVFVVQGVIALLFGWFVMFTGISDVRTLIPIVAISILCLGIIQTVNLLHREHNQHGRGLTVLIALMDIATSLGLFATMGQNVAWQLVIIAGYTLVRGLLEILLAFVSISDATDRFIWLVCGICGVILGFVILNSGHFTETTTFIKFFGSYMMIFGVSSLTYGAHNHNRKLEGAEERRVTATARKATIRSKFSRKSGTKATTTKSTSTKTTSAAPAKITHPSSTTTKSSKTAKTKK